MIHYSNDFPNNTKRSISEIFNKATIQFGQTVYGGKSNFTEGGTSEEWGYVEFDGSNDEQWAMFNSGSASTYAMKISVSDIDTSVLSDTSKLKANYFRTIANTETWGNYDTFISKSANSGNVVCGIRTITSVADWRAYLASNPLQVCYKLAEPFTIQLTPQELKLLQGTNTLTTNGTTIALDYIPNNSIGDAVKASEEYTDRAVERVAVAPKATLIDTWMISEESDAISVDLTSYDCNFFLLEYLFNSKRGTTLIPRPQGGSFSVSVVTYNNGSALYIELDYNPTTKELAYTSNVTSQFGILAIYTI